MRLTLRVLLEKGSRKPETEGSVRVQHEIVKSWVALYFRCNVSDRIELHHADVRK